MSDFLDQQRREIKARLDELAPAVQEYGRLREAIAALDGVAAAGTSSAATRRRGPRGTRAQQALEAIEQQPGLTAGQLAEHLGIGVNYLYRVLPGLENDGKLKHVGRGWFPADE